MSSIPRKLFIQCLIPLMLVATLTTAVSAAEPHPSDSLQATFHGRTVEVTGQDFAPGSRVSIVVLDIESWQPVFRGSTTADVSVFRCARGITVMCMQRADAGRVYLRATLRQRFSPSVLVLLYRSGSEVGVGRVRSQ